MLWQNFYRLDALPVTQPIASKHWRMTVLLAGDSMPSHAATVGQEHCDGCVGCLILRLQGSTITVLLLLWLYLYPYFLKLTASSRPSAPPSGSPKCLRFGHRLTLRPLNIHLLTYLLTYLLTWRQQAATMPFSLQKDVQQNTHDIQDCLGSQNSMFDIRQHQQSSFVTADCRYVARPDLQPVSHQNTSASNICEQKRGICLR